MSGRYSRRMLDAMMRERAGCIRLAYSRASGALIGVYRASDADLDTDGGAYAVCCETHGAILNTETRVLAMAHAAAPEWCEQCQKMMLWHASVDAQERAIDEADARGDTAAAFYARKHPEAFRVTDLHGGAPLAPHTDTPQPQEHTAMEHSQPHASAPDASGVPCSNPTHINADGEHIAYTGALWCALSLGGHAHAMKTPDARGYVQVREQVDACPHCGAPVCRECADAQADGVTCVYCEAEYTHRYTRRNADANACAVCDTHLENAAWRAPRAEWCRSCGAPVCNGCAPVNGLHCSYCGEQWPLDAAAWPYDHTPDATCTAPEALIFTPDGIYGRGEYHDAHGSEWHYSEWDGASCDHCGYEAPRGYTHMDGGDGLCPDCVTLTDAPDTAYGDTDAERAQALAPLTDADLEILAPHVNGCAAYDVCEADDCTYAPHTVIFDARCDCGAIPERARRMREHAAFIRAQADGGETARCVCGGHVNTSGVCGDCGHARECTADADGEYTSGCVTDCPQAAHNASMAEWYAGNTREADGGYTDALARYEQWKRSPDACACENGAYFVGGVCDTCGCVPDCTIGGYHAPECQHASAPLFSAALPPSLVNSVWCAVCGEWKRVNAHHTHAAAAVALTDGERERLAQFRAGRAQRAALAEAMEAADLCGRLEYLRHLVTSGRVQTDGAPLALHTTATGAH